MIVVFLVHDVSIIATRPRIIIIRRSIAIVSCPENKLWVIRYMIASFSSPPLVHINLTYILTLKSMKRKPINYSEQTPGGQQHHRRFLPLCSVCGLERAKSNEEVSPARQRLFAHPILTRSNLLCFPGNLKPTYLLCSPPKRKERKGRRRLTLLDRINFQFSTGICKTNNREEEAFHVTLHCHLFLSRIH